MATMRDMSPHALQHQCECSFSLGSDTCCGKLFNAPCKLPSHGDDTPVSSLSMPSCTLLNDILLPASLFSDPVHAITVVGDNVWVCTGNNANAGTIVVYDINTKALKAAVVSLGGCVGRDTGRVSQERKM
eukprot:353959-Chlamydomonas_euryale.AAC.3